VIPTFISSRQAVSVQSDDDLNQVKAVILSTTVCCMAPLTLTCPHLHPPAADTGFPCLARLISRQLRAILKRKLIYEATCKWKCKNSDV